MRKTEPEPATTAPSSGRPGLLDGRRLLLLVRRGRLGLPPRVGLMLLTATLLLGLCALLDRLHNPSRELGGGTGFDLPAELPSSKLDDTSAEAPTAESVVLPRSTLDRRDPAPPEELPPPALLQLAQSAGPEIAPVPEPPLPLPEPAPPTPAPVVSVPVPDPRDFDAVRYPHRGDTPMMCYWKTLGLQALLAAALTAAPAVAEDTADAKKLEDIQKQLGEIQKAIEGLSGLQKDVGDAKLNIARAQLDISQLREQLSKLQKDVDALRSQASGAARISGFGPAGGLGRIRLQNSYAVPATVIVNSRAYRLEPGQTQMLDNQPVGGFTFEVLVDGFGVVQTPTVRVLGANETYTIYVYPR
jgi:hypothetical protein